MYLDEQHVDRIHEDGLPSTKLRSILGIVVIAAAFSTSVILPAASLVIRDEPVDVEIQLSQEENDAWRHDDVDPAFALDGSPFFIEPAAGPPEPNELQTCHAPVAQEIACDHHMADE